MKRKQQTRLELETLENRWMPASASFSGGVLTITNTVLTAQTITITQGPASNQFTLSGNASGTFSGVTLINYRGSNGPEAVTLNLNAITYAGGAIFNTNGGNDSVAIMSGTMQGSLNSLTGIGNDSVSIGAAGSPVTIDGTANLSDTSGTNTLNIASGGATVTVNSDLTVTGFTAVLQGADDLNVARDLTINSSTTTGNDTISLSASGAPVTVGRNLFITTGSGSDVLTLGFDDPADALAVAGQLNISTGAGNDSVTINGGRNGFVNLILNTGAGNDSVVLRASADAVWQVNIQLGDGNDTFTLADGTGTALSSFITGNVSGGAGINVKTAPGGDWGGSISPYNETGF